MDINVNHIRHKLLFHTSWNNNFKRSNTFLCSQMCSHTLHLGALALFVFTDTFMRAHTPTSNTNSLHYESFWCLKSGDESCWFVCFFSTFFGPELTLQICWGGQRSREGHVFEGNLFYVLNAWHICMCVHHRPLSWIQLLSPPPALVCSAPVCSSDL